MSNSEESRVPEPRALPATPSPATAASPLADPSLAAFLQKSPTLRTGLAQLNRDGIEVVWGTAGGGTYLVPGSKIVIDADAVGQGGRIARSLSHEIGHHRFSEVPDQSSKQAYVSTLLRGEAAATLSNAQVRREILDGHGADIGISGTGDRPRQYQAVADQHLAGSITRTAALNQISEVFKTERPSVGPHATYELYYGDYHDTQIAPRQRRQGRPEPISGEPALSDTDVDRNHGRESRAGKSGSVLPSEPEHADHSLYQQIKGGVEQLDAQHGRGWDGSSERMTASLLTLAKETGLSRVDHVVLNRATDQLASGERVFLVQGALNDPAQQRTSMATMDAVKTPEMQSFEQLESLNQARAELNQKHELAQTHIQQQIPPSLSR